MKLEILLTGVAIQQQLGADVDVRNIQFDSRLVESGDLFVATRGTATDGHDYISKAIEQGAVAVVCETMPAEKPKSVVFVQVASSNETLGVLAANFYGNPSHNLTLVGVTGTNGKTTIATLLYQLFRKLGYKVGLLSTVCNYVDGRAIEATHTTPDALHLNALLAEMVAAGCEYLGILFHC